MLKSRFQTDVSAGNAKPVEIPADQLIQASVGSTAVMMFFQNVFWYFSLIDPFFEQFGPVTEMYCGKTVGRLVMQNIESTFSIGHADILRFLYLIKSVYIIVYEIENCMGTVLFFLKFIGMQI